VGNEPGPCPDSEEEVRQLTMLAPSGPFLASHGQRTACQMSSGSQYHSHQYVSAHISTVLSVSDEAVCATGCCYAGSVGEMTSLLTQSARSAQGELVLQALIVTTAVHWECHGYSALRSFSLQDPLPE